MVIVSPCIGEIDGILKVYFHERERYINIEET